MSQFIHFIIIGHRKRGQEENVQREDSFFSSSSREHIEKIFFRGMTEYKRESFQNLRSRKKV